MASTDADKKLAEYNVMLEKARAVQVKQVMPLIGPLLDAWELASPDVKSTMREECPTLCDYLDKIEEGMCADIGTGAKNNRGG